MASARWIVSRVRASLAPTRPANRRPTSRRNKGIDQLWATALAVSDLPVPCGPTRSTPRGSGKPKLLASSEKAWWRWFSQCLSASRPPMSAGSASVWQNSKTSLRARERRFSSRTSVRSSRLSAPRWARARAATWRTRASVSPLQAWVSSSSTSASRALPLAWAIDCRSDWISFSRGRGRSSKVRHSSSSAGGVQAPVLSTSVWGCSRNRLVRLRSIRAMPGSSQKR